MSRFKKAVLLTIGCLLLSVCLFVVDVLHAANSFQTLVPHSPSEVHTIEGLEGGTEDFALDGTLLYVSSVDFRTPGKQGAIYAVDTTNHTVRDVTPELSFTFRPHGISIQKKPKRLFVVNHRRGSALPDKTAYQDGGAAHSVEIFEIKASGELVWVRSIETPLFTSPNDVAIDDDHIYVSNDHHYATGAMRMAEDYLRLPVGTVVRCSLATNLCKVAYKGTRYANGVTMVGSDLLLAETTGGRLSLMTLGDDGLLTPKHVVPIKSGIDNIMISPDDGSWWIGAHPKLLEFVQHAEDGAHRSPSQVFRVDPKTFEVEEIYLNDGNPMSGSSVAVPVDGVVWVGAVLDPRLLHFDLEAQK